MEPRDKQKSAKAGLLLSLLIFMFLFSIIANILKNLTVGISQLIHEFCTSNCANFIDVLIIIHDVIERFLNKTITDVKESFCQIFFKIVPDSYKPTMVYNVESTSEMTPKKYFQRKNNSKRNSKNRKKSETSVLQGYCCACTENPAVQVFLPCNHLCLCEECCRKLPNPLLCPLCRQRPTKVINVILT